MRIISPKSLPIDSYRVYFSFKKTETLPTGELGLEATLNYPTVDSKSALSLSMLSLLRYSSLKSSRNRPLKFLIRLINSALPRAATEVAVFSKYLLEAIVRACEESLFVLKVELTFSVSSFALGDLAGKFRISL